MLKYLLDTNTISEPARPSPNRRLLGRLHRHEFEIAIAALLRSERVIPEGLENALTLALAIALLTVGGQAWRAATSDPVKALRYE